jgi:hypothetical protein
MQNATAQKMETLSTADQVIQHVLSVLNNTSRNEVPYPHLLPQSLLPMDCAKAVVRLPVQPVLIDETYGKRDSHNSGRVFFSTEMQAQHPVCAAVSEAFQSPEIVSTLQKVCDVDLKGSSLRIEYCQDGEGFWLEPHTDIGAKLFTMVLYLTEGPLSETMGTDIYDANKQHLGRAPSPFNSAIIFIPASNTWHGFEKRPMPDVRRSLIINYVKPEWRSRHELCFPNDAV